MSTHPLADLIANRVSNRDAANIPIPKYMLVVTIDANTIEELHSSVEQFAADMAVDWPGREFIDSTSGQMSVRLDRTNAEQTPERYAEQLRDWSSTRKSGGSES